MRPWFSFIGFLLSFAICFSYVSYFVFNEQIRDNPILIIVASSAAMLFSMYGAYLTIKNSSRRSLKILNIVLAIFALIFVTVFTLFVVKLSYDLPSTKLALSGHEKAPSFSLLDTQDREVRLEDFLGQNVLIVFYRGHW